MASGTIQDMHGDAVYTKSIGNIIGSAQHTIHIPFSETHLLYFVATVDFKVAIVLASAISNGYVRYVTIFNGGNDITLSTTGGYDGILYVKYATATYGVQVLDMPTVASATPSYCTIG